MSHFQDDCITTPTSKLLKLPFGPRGPADMCSIKHGPAQDSMWQFPQETQRRMTIWSSKPERVPQESEAGTWTGIHTPCSQLHCSQ